MINTENIEISYFSGYIRNYKKLCDELGIADTGNRETRELLILKNAYAKWQMKMTDHLCGAFAVHIRDNNTATEYCLRDQVGQKQMFYAVVNGKFICDGDIDKIAGADGFEKKLNMRMLQQYLFYGYPIGSETFYEGIYKLRPGHYAEWNGSDLKLVRYWSPVFEPDTSKTEDDWAEEIKNVVEEILGEEKADTALPYKESFLSGGVDSSYLFAASDAQAANTVGYEESGFDESALARQTADILGKKFNVRMISPGEYFSRIPLVMDKMGQPLGDASAVAFSIGCAAVKEHADVVYSGEGIDEFFGGYNSHKNPLKEGWTYLTCSHIMSEEVVKSVMRGFDENVKAVDPVAPLWNEVQNQDELAQKLTIDISLWLEGDIYLNTDRTSTACGIELHTPFSDIRLFNVARRIPADFKFRNDQNKYVFRKAAAGVLPDEVAFRKKVGFAVPIRKWLADEKFNRPIADTLSGEISKKFFNTEVIMDMWNKYLGGEEYLWSRIFALYAFLVWYEKKFGC